MNQANPHPQGHEKTDDKVSSQDRLLRLLALFADEEKSAWSVEEAAERLNLSTSHTYRYFRSLSSAGYISAFSAGRYILGPAIIELDRRMRIGDPMIRAASRIFPAMLEAAPAHSSAILCRYFRGQVMCVHEEFITRTEHEVSYERGLPRPLYQGAASKAVLAHLPLRQVKSYYEQNPNEFKRFELGSQWDEVKKRLRSLRTSQVVCTQGELDQSACGLSAPIFDDKRILGSVSLVIPAAQASDDVKAHLAPVVQAAGEKLTLIMQTLTTEQELG